MCKWMGPRYAFDVIHQCILTLGHYGWQQGHAAPAADARRVGSGNRRRHGGYYGTHHRPRAHRARGDPVLIHTDSHTDSSILVQYRHRSHHVLPVRLQGLHGFAGRPSSSPAAAAAWAGASRTNSHRWAHRRLSPGGPTTSCRPSHAKIRMMAARSRTVVCGIRDEAQVIAMIDRVLADFNGSTVSSTMPAASTAHR